MAMISPRSSPPLQEDAQEYVVAHQPQYRSHPAVIPKPQNGLEINIDFIPHSPNTIMVCTGADWEIDPAALNDVLYCHSRTVNHIVVTITFQDSRNETIYQKHGQSQLIQAVAKAINNFPFLQSLYVRLILPTKQFSQQKNAAYFWQLDLLTWSLWQKVGGEGGYKCIDYESHLAKDIAKYSRHLVAAGMM